MRINKFIAQAIGMSRRAADSHIAVGRVTVNGKLPTPGQDVGPDDAILLDDRPITPTVKSQTIILNKPVGYVCSRRGQGSKTIYELLPKDLSRLKPVGRLDKDSSGLLVLTTDGDLANQLTHPSYQKVKVYEVELDKPLTPDAAEKVKLGIPIEDYISRLDLAVMPNGHWRVSLSQGRNRQIRKTFEALGYTVTKLHRTSMGDYTLGDLASGNYKTISL